MVGLTPSENSFKRSGRFRNMSTFATTLPGLGDFDFGKLAVPRSFDRGVPASATLSGSPSIGLLWQRYLPSHQRYSSGSFDGPFGLDFQAIVTEAQRRESDPKRQRRAIEDVIQWWQGVGVLEWFARVATQAMHHSGTMIEHILDRRLDAIRDSGRPFVEAEYQTRSRAAVGLGNVSVIENSGLALHGTYGVPILPAASLKGIARALLVQDPECARTIVRRVLEAPQSKALVLELAEFLRADPAESCEALAQTLFGGVQADGEQMNEGLGKRAGLISIQDGLPVPLAGRPEDFAWFVVDVLTVHHQGYYDGRFDAADDTADPVPVHFLSLASGVSFSVLVHESFVPNPLSRGCRELCVEIAEALVAEALTQWGIGAKTGAGYGRMARPQ